MRPALETLKGKSNLVGAEIGVLGGDNAEDILKNLDIKKLYLIDNYIGNGYYEQGRLDAERERAQRLTGPIEWINKDSLEADTEPLDFCYIDANHDYEAVRKDIAHWRGFVKKGGLLGGHDIDLFDGVKRAVSELKDVQIEGEDWWIIV